MFPSAFTEWRASWGPSGYQHQYWGEPRLARDWAGSPDLGIQQKLSLSSLGRGQDAGSPGSFGTWVWEAEEEASPSREATKSIQVEGLSDLAPVGLRGTAQQAETQQAEPREASCVCQRPSPDSDMGWPDAATCDDKVQMLLCIWMDWYLCCCENQHSWGPYHPTHNNNNAFLGLFIVEKPGFECFTS